MHLRGLHYIFVSAADIVKPFNGQLYRNTDADFQWLVEHVARAARWLGYVDFERIVDERNAPAEIYCLGSFTTKPRASLSQGFGIHPPDSLNGALAELVPSLDLAMPRPDCEGSAPALVQRGRTPDRPNTATLGLRGLVDGLSATEGAGVLDSPREQTRFELVWGFHVYLKRLSIAGDFNA